MYCRRILRVKPSGKQRVLKIQKLINGNSRLRNEIRKARGQPLSCSRRNQEVDDESAERTGEEEKCETDIDVEEGIEGEEEAEEEQRGEREKSEDTSGEKEKCTEAIDIDECIAKRKKKNKEGKKRSVHKIKETVHAKKVKKRI